jgi:hypothetical protein
MLCSHLSVKYQDQLRGDPDLWLSFLAHVVCEDLLVLLARVLVCCLDDCRAERVRSTSCTITLSETRTELCRVDVGQLGTVTVSTTRKLLLIIIVVG